jgi:polar amino acid transport system substrate-binding protein
VAVLVGASYRCPARVPGRYLQEIIPARSLHSTLVVAQGCARAEGQPGSSARGSSLARRGGLGASGDAFGYAQQGYGHASEVGCGDFTNAGALGARSASSVSGSRGRRFRSAVAGLLVAGILLAGCGDRTSSPAAGTFTPATPGVLTVVTSEIPSEGFWSGTPDDPTGGLEYELALAFAQRFGLKSVHVELEHFNLVVAGHLDGADMALDLITPTAQRARQLDFSTPYLNSPPTVVVRAGTTVSDLETARGRRWGAVSETTFVGFIASLIAPVSATRTFDDNAQMLAGLESGAVDAVLQDMPLTVVTARLSNGRLQAVAQLPGAETIAAALPRGSPNVEAVNSAIRAFTADGTIDRLLRTWIGPSAADAEKAIPLLRTSR